MGLIKSNTAPAVSTFSMRDVETHAQLIIARAKQKAEQMLIAAQEQAEQLAEQIKADAAKRGLEEGRVKGRQEGLAAGKEAALTEQRGKFETAVKALTEVVTTFDGLRNEFEAEASTDVINLAVAIARRVTQRQGLQQNEVLLENVRQAVRLVAHHASVTVTLHPQQKAFLDETLPQLKTSWPKVTHVELQTDPAIAPGGCRVTSGLCEINAELDKQIDRIVADLLPAEPTQ